MHPTTSLYFLCRLISVTLGAHNIQKQGKTQQVITERQAILHPDYNPKNLSNDIMLLKLREPSCCSCCPGSRLLLLPLGPVPSLLPILAG